MRRQSVLFLIVVCLSFINGLLHFPSGTIWLVNLLAGPLVAGLLSAFIIDNIFLSRNVKSERSKMFFQFEVCIADLIARMHYFQQDVGSQWVFGHVRPGLTFDNMRKAVDDTKQHWVFATRRAIHDIEPIVHSLQLIQLRLWSEDTKFWFFSVVRPIPCEQYRQARQLGGDAECLLKSLHRLQHNMLNSQTDIEPNILEGRRYTFDEGVIFIDHVVDRTKEQFTALFGKEHLPWTTNLHCNEVERIRLIDAEAKAGCENRAKAEEAVNNRWLAKWDEHIEEVMSNEVL